MPRRVPAASRPGRIAVRPRPARSGPLPAFPGPGRIAVRPPHPGASSSRRRRLMEPGSQPGRGTEASSRRV